ncbi:Dihydropteroate synthase [Rickettsiales endosymbiont of Paramecium tredecaurelia]|uniref:dihydropteroate synthase n=1 Tax=Candidatus Sarmatiella mevalonica TaxID=2770581 RepID=UPI001922F100|nr:dihydropteroate synthase [Candidatus Sarmatiella mevalonica]MBL3285111.1 Dihydropteroate synthase [Candidatus Sarmatiella mevalonica]
MIYLALGSNVGNRIANLFEALELLSQNFKIIKKSIIIKTKAIHCPNRDDLAYANLSDSMDYFNMVLEGSSDLEPREFLAFIKHIECKMGRDLGAPRWSARIIDIDILLWHDLRIEEASLIIPHAQIIKRDFILHLLSILNPSLTLALQVEDLVYEDVDDSIVHEEFAQKYTDVNHDLELDILDDISLIAKPNQDVCIFGLENERKIGKRGRDRISIANLAHHRSAEQSVLEGSMSANVKLVGILNLTNLSFSRDVVESVDACLAQMLKMQEDGAYIIDVGGQATNPKVRELDVQREEKTVRTFFKALSDYNRRNNQHYKVSLDSFTPKVIDYALGTNLVTWINDVTGALPQDLVDKIYDTNKVKLLAMHSLTVPPSKHNIVSDTLDISKVIQEWIYGAVKKFNKLACDNRLILDPGIGFGKSIYQNIELLRVMQKLDWCGCQVLVGHSRKSFLLAANPIENPIERDFETIAISSVLSELKVDYLRVHDIAGHQRYLAAQNLMTIS